jgi:uncharacterized repeat protein (TIGR01451 family)
MKNSFLSTLQFLILLALFCSSPAGINAQTSVCDVRLKFGEPVGPGGANIIFPLFCDLPPRDIVHYINSNYIEYMTATCKGCMWGGATPYPHSSGDEIAGTPSCAAYGREMVIDFSMPVADVDVPVWGARTVSDNRGNVVHLTPAPNARTARFEGPGITRITISDPIEFNCFDPGTQSNTGGCWDMYVADISFGSEAAYYQCNCNRPTFARPASQSAFSPDWNGNGIQDWRMDVDVSDDDGLVLKNIRLENRYMAEQISVPYYYLETNSISRTKGELTPESDPLQQMASHLVNFNSWSDDEKLVVEATYVVRGVPVGSTNCLEIVQRYEFYKSQPGDKCEPSGTLPCARWKPIVSYKFRGPEGEFHNINIAQRQHRTVDNNSYNSVGLFRDHDHVEDVPLSLFNYFEKWCNPLPREWGGQITVNGKDAKNWDNVHQTFKGKVEEPYPVYDPSKPFPWISFDPGCPECIHSHWRWGAITDGEGNGKLLGIPFGSTQDLDFGIVLNRVGEEDPSDYHNLVGQNPEQIRTSDTTGRDQLQINWGRAPLDVVYWQSGTGRQTQDSFFSYGAFFNPSLPEQHLIGGGGSSPQTSLSKRMYVLSSQDGITSIIASQIYAVGSTTTAAFDASLGGSLPAGYSQYSDLSYEVITTAEASGPYTTTFTVPSVSDQATFDSLRAFHLEQDPFDPNAVIWIDRTLLPPDPQQPNFATRTLNARANSLGHFVVASLTQPQPPNTGVADVAVSMTDSQDPLVVGNELTYTITVANGGPQAATGLVFSNALSPDVKFVSVAATQGSCSEVEGTVVCKLGSLAASVNATITIVAKPTESRVTLPPAGIPIINEALARANEADPIVANNTATENTTVLPDSNAAPATQITTPVIGSLFVGPANVTINANATDTDGSVSQVDLYGDGNLLGAGTLGSPGQYAYTWTNVPYGAHVLVAVATDNVGKASASDPVSIIVNGSAAVSVTSPGNWAVFNRPANISITANASVSGGTISRVDFYEDGSLLGTGVLTGGSQYSFTRDAASAGQHVLTAVATDGNAITTTSTAVNIIVNDPPVISLLAPAGGSVYATAPANVTVTANTSDWDGGISKVDFYANGSLIGTNSSHGVNQFNLTWSNVGIGTYSLTAVATDIYGASATSTPVTVRVNTPPAVSITSPASGSQFTVPANITLIATATDSDGTVSNVDFFANNSRLGSGTAIGNNQFSFIWNGVGFGTYNISATATDNNGTSTGSSSASIIVKSPVLLVAGSTTLNTSDAAVKTRLEALNHIVTVKDAASVTATDANGKALVVISSTVTPATLGTKLRTVAVPVITWESGSFNNMGMTGSTNKDFGTKINQTQIAITNSSHPLAAGLSGTVTVVSAGKTFDWGKPSTNALSIATIAGDATKTAIFGYEPGAVMVGLTAPARRVGLYLFDDTAASFNANGTALLDAAIKWARGGGSITGGIVTSPVGTVNLTTAGTLDWAHWGRNGPTSFDHKAAVTQQITNITKIGTGALTWFADCPTAFTWTDGTPTLNVTSTPTGINTNGIVGNGFEITVPADTNLKTVKVYVGVWYAQGKLEATLSDGSAPAFVDNSMNKNNGASSGLYTITYKAAASGQNLKIRFTILNQYFSPNGNVAWEAVTLQ